MRTFSSKERYHLTKKRNEFRADPSRKELETTPLGAPIISDLARDAFLARTGLDDHISPECIREGTVQSETTVADSRYRLRYLVEEEMEHLRLNGGNFFSSLKSWVAPSLQRDVISCNGAIAGISIVSNLFGIQFPQFELFLQHLGKQDQRPIMQILEKIKLGTPERALIGINPVPQLRVPVHQENLRYCVERVGDLIGLHIPVRDGAIAMFSMVDQYWNQSKQPQFS